MRVVCLLVLLSLFWVRCVWAESPSQECSSSAEEMFEWIEALCEGPHRRPGTIEDHRAAFFIAQKFIELGLEDVRIEPVPLDVWTPGK